MVSGAVFTAPDLRRGASDLDARLLPENGHKSRVLIYDLKRIS